MGRKKAVTETDKGSWSRGGRSESLQKAATWDDVEADAKIRQGLPINLAMQLQQLLELTDEEIADLIGRSRSTYNRYRNQDRELGASEAERVVRYAKLLSLAADTFGSLDEARAWFFEENYSLGGRTPFVMAETDPGSRVVENLLRGLQHGHPA